MRLLWAGLLVCLVLPAAPSDAWAEDAGTPALDAGVEDAGHARPDSGLSPGDLDTLIRAKRSRVQLMQDAVSGAPNPDVPLRALFGLDLRDESAVSRRASDLGRELRGMRSRYPVALAGAFTSSVATSTPTHPSDVVLVRLTARALQLEQAFLMQRREVRLAQLDAEQASAALAREREQAREQQARAVEQAQAAEAQRAQALEEARNARTALLKELNSRRAAVERARVDLARADKMMLRRRGQRAAEVEALLSKSQRLLASERGTKSSSAALSQFERSEEQLKSSLARLEEVFVLLDEDLGLPDVSGLLVRLETDAPLEVVEAHGELTEALEQYQAYAGEIEVRESATRHVALQLWFKRCVALADARFRLLWRLPDAELERRISITSAATWQEVRFEIRTLSIVLRAQTRLRIRQVRQLPETIREIRTLGAAGWTLLQILLIIGGALWLRRQAPQLLERYRRHERGHVRSIALLRRLDWGELVVRRFSGILLYLLVVHLLWWVAASGSEFFELDVVFIIALAVGYYRLFRRVLDVTVTRLARRRRVRIDRATRAQIQRSIMLAGRTVLAVGLLLSLERRIVRNGVLYHFLELGAYLLLAVVAFILLRRWRESIAAAYLRLYPEGRLARAVEATKGRSTGLLVVAAAFIWVAARTIWTIGSETALSFDQTRRALAFIFRKKLEKKAESIGEWEGKVEALPEDVLVAFSGRALKDEMLRVDHCPGLDKFKVDVEEWKAGRARGSYLVRGSRGFGKTTWLYRALSELDPEDEIEVSSIALDRKPRDALLSQIRAPLGLDPTDDLDDAIQALNEGPKRIVCLDDIHCLFLRTLGGTEALDGLMHLIEHTGRQVFWLTSVDEMNWRFISAVRPRRARFRSEQVLKQWSEEEIRQLLMARAAGSGVVHHFADLVVSDEEALSEHVLARTSEGYTRLIWDYSDGCPWAALHYWLRSLVPMNGDHVNVRFFKAPEVERLERSPEESVFLYAAIAMHERLSVPEAARVLRYPEPFVESALIRACEEGFLNIIPGTERYGLSVHWYRAMVRFLRRRHVL